MSAPLTRCYIGLGSNLQDPSTQLHQAIETISALPLIILVAQSSFYRSPPFFPPPQPDYINAVIAIDTYLTSELLLQTLQAIELQQGRFRTDLRNSARTLDLDILLYGELICTNPILTLPHPRMTERNFVLYPLHEIAPTLKLPTGEVLATLLASCSNANLAKL